MAYQNVGGTPRFYIDHIQYLKSIGFDFQKWYDDYGFDYTNKSKKSVLDDPDIFTLKPEIQKQVFSKHTLIDGATNINYLYWDIPTGYPIGTNFTSDDVGFFVAMLNHNLKTKGLTPHYERALESAVVGVAETSIINHNTNSNPNEDGCSIYEISNINPDIADNEAFFRLVFYDNSENGNATDFNIGALSLGFYYDMPVSPDLDLSMDIEFDGYDNTRTLNGSTLTNTRYMGSPWWFDTDGNKKEPWAVGDSTGLTKRNGRRVWNLSFSYMSDKDLFASNYGSSTYAEEGNLTEIGYDGGDVDTMNWGQDVIINGDFTGLSATGTSEPPVTEGSWIVYTGVSLGSNVATWGSDGYYANGDRKLVQMNVFANVLSTYKITFTLTRTAGKFRFWSGSYWHPWIEVGGTYTFEFSPQTGSGNLHFAGDDDFRGTLDSVSVVRSYPSDFQYTINNDDSFHAQVLNRISHGQKFIFQPDNTNNNPDQFAICVLDQDSLDIKRVAPRTYNIKMKIKEVW